MDSIQEITESLELPLKGCPAGPGNTNRLNCVDVLLWSTKEEAEDEGVFGWTEWNSVNGPV